MDRNKRFSERHGVRDDHEKETTIRNDAPVELRHAVTVISGELDLSPKPLRRIVCQVLRKAPDQSNWSEHANIVCDSLSTSTGV